MKKILLTLLLTAASLVCAAQTEAIFLQKQGQLSQELSDASKSKDHAAAEKYCSELIQLWTAQPTEVQQKFAGISANYYYNLACMQSLQGKRKAALRSFEQACKLGYNDYRHVLADTDFDNIRTDKTFQRLHAAMRETGDYLYILQNAGSYAPAPDIDSLPRFTYMAPNDRNLVRVREYFKLDSVAGSGDELSKIQRMLTYIHDKIRHDGSHGNPNPMNAIALADSCKDGSRGLNCRGLATVLNECYLAMGIPSRIVTCMPKVYISDCHVINAVYSATLDKWVWIDPTQNAWVMDENGVMLSIQEVRERLRDGRPLVLNPTANWNNRTPATKARYLENYMAKNLYCIFCSDRSQFATEVFVEGMKPIKYTFLCPTGFTPDYKFSKPDFVTTDDAWFWQSPYKK